MSFSPTPSLSVQYLGYAVKSNISSPRGQEKAWTGDEGDGG